MYVFVMDVKRYFMAIDRPGNRAGWELYFGPLILNLTWPLQAPGWSWGWWHPANRLLIGRASRAAQYVV
jgi:hypothetical protein